MSVDRRTHSASAAPQGIAGEETRGNPVRTCPRRWRIARTGVLRRFPQQLRRWRLGIRRPRPRRNPLLPSEADHYEKCIAARQGVRVLIPRQRTIADCPDRVRGQDLPIDRADCQVIWSSAWTPHDHEPTNTHRGAALADGKVIRGTDDGFLLALDAKDGHTIWTKQIADPKEGYFISMPPLAHDKLVYIGPAGAETAAHGWVAAFRVSDGEQVWRFNIVPADGEPGADTWGPDPAARKHGGGNLWTPMSFDVQRNLLYLPGGNAAPDLYDNDRPGANLYTNSLIALDATTGHLAWYRQFVPHDVHDYDVTHVAPVFKTTIAGSTRDVIASTGKDGLLRLLDRDSKDTIYSVPFTNRVNTEAPITTTPVRVCPGTLGGQEWNGSAYYAKQNLLIVPATDWCAEFNKDAAAPDPEKEHTHAFYFGGVTKFEPWSAARGRLTAFDASTGHEKWRYDSAKPMVAGVTATAGDVIFAGELTGDLLALDAGSGKVD